MKIKILSTLMLTSATALLYLGCGNGSANASNDAKTNYLRSLENENNISYAGKVNTDGSYITSMCYTRVKDDDGSLHNPCYSCHTKGRVPNYYNDTNLQKEYFFPETMLQNPFTNLFKDRSAAVAKISDSDILNYVRTSNYFDANGSIALAKVLPENWGGYRPDCYFDFDAEGFDHAPDGSITGWRAFRYYPFLGTFWPTNGSTDDVLIKLPEAFRQDGNGTEALEVYKINLAIVEAVVKQKSIALESSVDERLYGVDLNQNGVFDNTDEAVFNAADGFTKMAYVGKAKAQRQEGKVHLAGGLFPEGTEFLHSVRYIDWDEDEGHIRMAARMKELRYAIKREWKTYSELSRAADAELFEAQINGTTQGVMATFYGNYETGFENPQGWSYQGFIEARDGTLRPQTREETINCMGCHSHLGATTDSVFAFPRKFEGTDKTDKLSGWNHWSQKGLIGIPEPKMSYIGHGEQFEYSFYLQNNHSGNEFRDNDEVKAKFFDANGSLKPNMVEQLHNDVSVLLFPSKTRALGLDKGYRVMVQEQSFIYGRDANVHPMQNVYKTIEPEQETGITQAIVRQ